MLAVNIEIDQDEQDSRAEEGRQNRVKKEIGYILKGKLNT
jgi:hypothetical protein